MAFDPDMSDMFLRRELNRPAPPKRYWSWERRVWMVTAMAALTVATTWIFINLGQGDTRADWQSLIQLALLAYAVVTMFLQLIISIVQRSRPSPTKP